MKRLIAIFIIFTMVILGGLVFAQNDTSQHIRSIARSDFGLYAAVGDGGLIITSEDATSWKKVSMEASGNLNGVIWAMGRFVAVGDEGIILTSLDGKDWAKTGSIKGTIDLFSVASSGKEIIATGNDGTVLISKDGVSWEQRRMATAERINRVRWINDRYIAVGGAMLILTSTDGVTWDEVKAEPSSTIMFTDVAWDGDKYVVVGDHLSIWVSKDGKAWTQDESILKKDEMDYTLCIYSIVWTGDKFVAVGQKGIILYSNDGSDWYREAEVTRKVLKDIIYSNNKFVVIGDRGSILTSEDGSKWVNHNSISAQSNEINLKVDEQKLLNIILNHPYGESEDITKETLFEVIDGKDLLSVDRDGTMKANGVGHAIVKATYDYETIEVSVRVESSTTVQSENNDNRDEGNNKANNSTKLSDVLLTLGGVFAVITLITISIKKGNS
ncbi:MAG: hypothetical protein GX270_05060 [Clostridiaceae bacterium]|jgi:photosystem II stability/assembly factor-like uncharacterized protein|nr:hypothetical protein [Clostridiaceae bacterium]